MSMKLMVHLLRDCGGTQPNLSLCAINQTLSCQHAVTQHALLLKSGSLP